MNLIKRLIYFTALIYILLSSCTNTLTPPIVRTLSASILSVTTITATGKVLSDYGLPITSYGLCLSQDSLPTINDTKKEHLSEKYSPGIEYSESFTDLILNKTYYVRAYAINTDGVAYGKSICVKTTFSPLVTNSAASEITMTEATLAATINPMSTKTENWFEYWVEGSSIQKVASGSSMGNSDVPISVKLKELIPGKTYSFVAKSKNEYGTTVSATSKFDTYAVADYDGNLYHTVTIGTQTWLKENLKTTHFANGDVIPHVNDPEVWQVLKTGAYVQYNNDSKISDIYGLLYNWYLASDIRELIAGYHVPDSEDWSKLEDSLGGYYVSAGVKLIGIESGLWDNPLVAEVYKPYINSSGFTALPNGTFYEDGITHKYIFTNLHLTATFGSSDQFNGMSCPLIIESKNCFFGYGGLFHKDFGFGLRLVKD